MSPGCFPAVFDGIGEVWFDGCAQKRDTIVTLVRHGRWCVFRHQRPYISTQPSGWLRRSLDFEAGSTRSAEPSGTLPQLVRLGSVSMEHELGGIVAGS